jgi:hypothetical protein
VHLTDVSGTLIQAPVWFAQAYTSRVEASKNQKLSDMLMLMLGVVPMYVRTVDVLQELELTPDEMGVVNALLEGILANGEAPAAFSDVLGSHCNASLLNNAALQSLRLKVVARFGPKGADETEHR